MNSTYSYLWTSPGRYALLRDPEHPSLLERFVILDLELMGAIIIEDEAEHLEAIKEMQRAGVPVIDSSPW